MDFKEQLKSLYAITLSEDEPMSEHTGYGVGGKAKYFVTVYSARALSQVMQLCDEHRVKYKIIGNGTNLLFSDKGFEGVVISLKGLSVITHENGIVRATAGVRLCDLVLFSAEFGLFGGETLVGIPATVGGATVMNAGAYGYSISDFIQSVTTVKKGKLIKYDKNQCGFSYRRSVFQNRKEAIISVDFRFKQGKGKEIPQELIKRCKQIRNNVQPKGKSCGSVFKNPNGDYAGRLIECAGLKGYSVGNASISLKHANFIITKKGATAEQVYKLITSVQKIVKEKFGISLTREVELVGEF
ncbi:MAG: UDP-N-acetylmuramate dehydrogenase [Clostridia bacterium]|nr:UDP-N-acetylmuramate dehydrogenase [Clostridia bacterium]